MSGAYDFANQESKDLRPTVKMTGALDFFIFGDIFNAVDEKR